MALSLQTLAGCLGKPLSTVLVEAPFSDWVATKSFDGELGVFDVRFLEDGADLLCDSDERVTTLFIFNHDGRHLKQDIVELPFSCTREEVLRHLGRPEKSGKPTTDKVSGKMGAWDRFARPGYAIHIQYQNDADRIGMITLMRADIVPS